MQASYETASLIFGNRDTFAKSFADPAIPHILTLAKNLSEAYTASLKTEDDKAGELKRETIKLTEALDAENKAYNELKDTQYQALVQQIEERKAAIADLKERHAELEALIADIPKHDETGLVLQRMLHEAELAVLNAQQQKLDELVRRMAQTQMDYPQLLKLEKEYQRTVADAFKHHMQHYAQQLKELGLENLIQNIQALLTNFSETGNDIFLALAELMQFGRTPQDTAKAFANPVDHFAHAARSEAHESPTDEEGPTEDDQPEELPTNIGTLIELALSKRNVEDAIGQVSAESEQSPKQSISYTIPGSAKKEKLTWNPNKAFLQNLKDNLDQYPGGLFRYRKHKKAVAHIKSLIPSNVPNDAKGRKKIAAILTEMANYLHTDQITPIGRNGKQSYVYSLFVFAILQAFNHYEQFEKDLMKLPALQNAIQAHTVLRSNIEKMKLRKKILQEEHIGPKQKEAQQLTQQQEVLAKQVTQLEEQFATQTQQYEAQQVERTETTIQQAEEKLALQQSVDAAEQMITGRLDTLYRSMTQQEPPARVENTEPVQALQSLIANVHEAKQTQQSLITTTLRLLGQSDKVNPEALYNHRDKICTQLKSAKPVSEPTIQALSAPRPRLQDGQRYRNSALVAAYGLSAVTRKTPPSSERTSVPPQVTVGV